MTITQLGKLSAVTTSTRRMVLCGGQVVVDHQETAQFLAVEIDETVGCDDLQVSDWEDGAVWGAGCG